MVHTRRTNPNFNFRLKTDLQKRRDYITSRISKKWLPQRSRPSLESRGLQNSGLYTCYQNSALQALLHQPAFLNWIRSHKFTRGGQTTNPCTKPANCLACFMKDLVNRYWGPEDPDYAIESNATELTNISACAYASGQFTSGVYEDSNFYYNWILQNLQNATVTAAWRSQFDALYELTLQPTVQCSACAHRRQIPRTHDVGLNLTIGDDMDQLEDAIGAYFDDETDIDCPGCGSPLIRHRRVHHIEAAPAILKISYTLFHNKWINGRYKIGKVTVAIDHPNELDLTDVQQNDQIPLLYTLSSVISHRGTGKPLASDPEKVDGHYIATVRGPHEIACISDDDRQVFTQEEFEENPQRPKPPSQGDFQVYTLTYLRTKSGVEKKLSCLL